jgi:hypothetical protein
MKHINHRPLQPRLLLFHRAVVHVGKLSRSKDSDRALLKC